MKSSEQIARSAYEKLSVKDRWVVMAWRELGNDWATSMLNSGALSTGRCVHPAEAARVQESDRIDEMILRLHQRSMPTDEALRRRETAEHEAAHSVVAQALGLEVRAAYVTTDGGHCLHTRGTPHQTATVALAGQVWISIFRSLEFPRGATGCADDRRKAADAVDTGMAWEKAHRQCFEILKENRAAVLALADRIDRDGNYLP